MICGNARLSFGEAPTPATFVEAEAHAAVNEPLAITREVEQARAAAMRCHNASERQPSAATAPGTITHLAVAALADTANVKLNHVPFRGDGELMGQVIGGHVDFGSVTLASAAAAGPSVRVIAIFADARSPSAPDTPTTKEQGYDVAPTSFGGLFAPTGTPDDVLTKIGNGCKIAVEQPAYLGLAKQFHQGDRFYADAATFGKRLDADVADKKALLQRIGLVK